MENDELMLELAGAERQDQCQVLARLVMTVRGEIA